MCAYILPPRVQSWSRQRIDEGTDNEGSNLQPWIDDDDDEEEEEDYDNDDNDDDNDDDKYSHSFIYPFSQLTMVLLVQYDHTDLRYRAEIHEQSLRRFA